MRIFFYLSGMILLSSDYLMFLFSLSVNLVSVSDYIVSLANVNVMNLLMKVFYFPVHIKL